MRRRYQLWVDTPIGYDPDVAHPLVLCLDAPWTYGTAVDTVRLLGLGRQIKPAIVAGIAHDVGKREVLTQRAMDFTVTQAEFPAEIGVRATAGQMGGAEEFRIWLADVVLPLIRADYPISGVTLAGHSFSALFGVHVLLTAAEMFEGYLLASPSVWWDDQVMFEREAEHAASGAKLAAKVFMSMGAEETDELSHHAQFHRRLAGRNHAGLNLAWHSFAGESHMSVVSAAVNRGLRHLLANEM